MGPLHTLVATAATIVSLSSTRSVDAFVPVRTSSMPQQHFHFDRKRRRRSNDLPATFHASTTKPKLQLHSSNDELINDVDVGIFDAPTPLRPFKNYFATCVPGLQDVLAQELIDLGASNVETSGTSGVQFTNNPEQDTTDIGLNVLLWTRTAHRVMEMVATTTGMDGGEKCQIYDADELYNFVRATIHVQSLLGNGQGGLLTLSVKAVANGQLPKELCHTHYTSLTVKNALVDAVRDLRDDGTRPNVDLDDADVPLIVVLRGYSGKSADVSLYRALHSGGSLHRRGYRSGGGGESTSSGSQDDDSNHGEGTTPVHKAAMKESLGAGLLLQAGYDKLIAAAKFDGFPAILIDPMTGSANFPIEAGLIASDIAPGLMRIRSYKYADRNPHKIPPAVRWKDGNIIEWKKLLAEASSRAKTGIAWTKGDSETYPGRKNCEIYANEYNPRAAELARRCIEQAGFSSLIVLNKGDCIDWDLGGMSEESGGEDRIPIEGRTIVATNPPWGKRLSDDISESWESLKVFLRRECNGTEAWILNGNKSLTRILRMKRTRSFVIRTGGEDLRWLQYHIFKKKDSDSNSDSESAEEEEEDDIGSVKRGAIVAPEHSTKTGVTLSAGTIRRIPKPSRTREQVDNSWD